MFFLIDFFTKTLHLQWVTWENVMMLVIKLIVAKLCVDNAEFLERGQVRLNTESEYKWDSTIKLLQRQPYPARIESITLGLNFNDKS